MPTTVSEVTQQVREIIQDNSDLQDIWIRGRISKIGYTPKGIVNFTLTDSVHKMECVISKDTASPQHYLLSVGSHVCVKGQIEIYEIISEYRFRGTDVHLMEGIYQTPFVSISDLTITVKSALEKYPPVKVQGEIAKVFVTRKGFTVLKLKDVTADEEVNEIIECVLPPIINSPFPLRQGDRITAEGKFGTFRATNTYRIVIDTPDGLSRWSASEQQASNRCQECGQRCKQSYSFCLTCHYAQVHHEGIVVGAVTRYFDSSRFANFSTKREYRIKWGAHKEGRADIALLNSEGNPVAIAECKRIGYDGYDGIIQLESYLNAKRTDLGLFADNTDPYEWTFLKWNNKKNEYDKITRSQFDGELGIEPAPEIPPTKTQFEIVHGNIIKTEVDAIVNPTDSHLSGGGGLDGAIRYAGGETIDEECRRIQTEQEALSPGHAVMTTGGNLWAKHVIHTVGSIWKGGNSNEPEQLANCYKNSLRLAGKKRIQSIAFPAISTGNYGYPIEKAARIALTAVKEFVEQAHQNNEMVPERIQFVLFDQEAYACYIKELSRLGLGLFSVIG